MTRYAWPDAVMLAIVMLSLIGIFLGGLAMILGDIGAKDFDAPEIVSILSLPVGVISAVAAGIFGYSLGTRGTTEAQQAASAAAQEAAAVRQETAAVSQESAAPTRDIGRIVSRARAGGLSATTNKYEISEDDLNTLIAHAEPLARRLGIEMPPPTEPPQG